eukprot:g1339.t1
MGAFLLEDGGAFGVQTAHHAAEWIPRPLLVAGRPWGSWPLPPPPFAPPGASAGGATSNAKPHSCGLWPGANCPYAWVGADSLDPPNPGCGAACWVSELYNLGAAPYESVLLGLLAVFRGSGGGAGGGRATGELNELHLGTSRGGFHFSRPTARRPLLGFAYPDSGAAFPNSDVQSAANGLVVTDDTVTVLAMARTGQPQWAPGHSPGGNRTMGAATPRRGGFASLECTGAGTAPAAVLTRSLIFGASQERLFLNARVATGGWLQVGVAVAGTTAADVNGTDGTLRANVTVPGLAPADSVLQDPVQDSVAGGGVCDVEFDSTRASVRWRPGAGLSDLSGVAGRPVRLFFRMSGVSLFSFWVAPDPCGASGGFLGATGRDEHGSCA